MIFARKETQAARVTPAAAGRAVDVSPAIARTAKAAAPATAPGAVAMPEGDDAKLMSRYSFTDMYIDGDRRNPTMVTGLKSAALGILSRGRGLSPIPVALRDDVRTFHAKILAASRERVEAREFILSYRGERYRCSFVAPRNASPQTDIEHDSPGTAWCVRKLPSFVPSLDELRFPAWARSDVDELRKQKGLVIVSGAFASGKTTLASAVMDHWVSTSRGVGLVLEDPPEIDMAKVTEDKGIIYQQNLKDMSVRGAIEDARRWAPKYLFLGEIRTHDVCSELLAISISGSLAICTVHSSDPVQAIVSLFRFASESMAESTACDMIANSLKQVFHQELVNGRANLSTAKVHGDEIHLVTSKIRAGNFRGLYEDLERHRIVRSRG